MGYIAKVELEVSLDVESPETLRVEGTEQIIEVATLSEDAAVQVAIAYIRGICQDSTHDAWSVAAEAARVLEGQG